MDGLYDTIKIDKNIGRVNNQSISAIWKGKKDCLVTHLDKYMVEFVRVPVKVCPAATVKRFATLTEADRRGSGVNRNKITGNLVLKNPDGSTYYYV